MLYIVKIPHQQPPIALSFASISDFIGYVRQQQLQEKEEGEIFWKGTASDLARVCRTAIEDLEAEGLGWIADLGNRYGWDTMLYTAEWLGVEYSPLAVSEFDACAAYLQTNLSELLIFESESAAITAVENDSLWCTHHGAAAKKCLRAELFDEKYLKNTSKNH